MWKGPSIYGELHDVFQIKFLECLLILKKFQTKQVARVVTGDKSTGVCHFSNVWRELVEMEGRSWLVMVQWSSPQWIPSFPPNGSHCLSRRHKHSPSIPKHRLLFPSWASWEAWLRASVRAPILILSSWGSVSSPNFLDIAQECRPLPHRGTTVCVRILVGCGCALLAQM